MRYQWLGIFCHNSPTRCLPAATQDGATFVVNTGIWRSSLENKDAKFTTVPRMALHCPEPLSLSTRGKTTWSEGRVTRGCLYNRGSVPKLYFITIPWHITDYNTIMVNHIAGILLSRPKLGSVLHLCHYIKITNHNFELVWSLQLYKTGQFWWYSGVRFSNSAAITTQSWSQPF